ncbi:MAG: ATP-dependent exonuclease SbcCD, C subunit-like protein [Oligoflexus sp.]|nr:ATP-dependent exonuclease SbcCD, C subunit-like protein [Oligoflexus sp.]
MFERLEGFRLNRFELLNWGTFDQKIWKIEPKNLNSLLTGDIGSGKSTLVDALTILLVPRASNQIVFNKAAGAEAQERSLRSYVLGEYKTEVDADGQKAKAVPLRGPRSYSVLLASFYNQTTDKRVNIAQLFYFREKGGAPERLFVVSEEDLSIASNFQNFDDIPDLRRRLRLKGAKVNDGLKEYAAQFRRLMGIASERALELFYQTLSLKSVSDLTQFVRDHMLDSDDSKQRVDELCHSFEDLDRAHKSVVRARQQIEILNPLVKSGLDLQTKEIEHQSLFAQREILEAWTADHILRLEKLKHARLEEDFQKVETRIVRQDIEIDECRARERGLELAINSNGGARLQELERDQKRIQQELGKAQETRGTFKGRLDTIGLSMPTSTDQFIDLNRQLNLLHETSKSEENNFDTSRLDLSISFKSLQSEIQVYRYEIESLKGRPSNIPRHLLELRQSLCQALDIDPTDIPFAGELIQVAAEEQAWEGAIERVIHNFALSLLVGEKHYRQVSEWVDRTHLKGRIVYHRLISKRQHASFDRSSQGNLLSKLILREESFAYEWLLNHLSERFDYRCCDTLEEFRQSSFALTQNGQIKSGGDRHEKNDKYDISDRGRFVLGWNSQAKLKALEATCQKRELEAQSIGSQLAETEKQRRSLQEKIRVLDLLLDVRSFQVIDLEALLIVLNAIDAERKLIEQASVKLRELQTELSTVQHKSNELRDELRRLQEKRAEIKSNLQVSVDSQSQAISVLSSQNALRLTELMPLIEHRYTDLYQDEPNLQNVKARERAMREKMQSEMRSLIERQNQLRETTVKLMQDYRRSFPTESTDLDTGLEYFPEYCRILNELEVDGLPAFELRFKQELNEKTIQSVAAFRNRLERSQREIKDRLRQINGSLHGIDYNDGTFIELQIRPNIDVEVRQFQNDLKACLEGNLGGSDLYTEQSFLRVKALIERFRGSEADRRWTTKVTDVRHWFDFAANEIWRETGISREYYESGNAKSGGQKEKLAYTVLASALAYQYGVNEEQAYKNSFRFVCIDEAFGKGSDESTRYGLELFRKMGLQLLVVTPMQKIRVIEDYVNAVHFVHNEGGKNSMLRNMSIEEYKKERDQIHPQSEEYRADILQEVLSRKTKSTKTPKNEFVGRLKLGADGFESDD